MIMKPKIRSRIINTILFTIPLWLPFVYLYAVSLEHKATFNGPLNELAGTMLFLTPAIGTIPVFTTNQHHFLLKLLAALTYYCIGLFIAGIIGWGVCMEMNLCH